MLGEVTDGGINQPRVIQKQKCIESGDVWFRFDETPGRHELDEIHAASQKLTNTPVLPRNRKKSPVSRCHLQLTSATIKSTERPANQPTIEEEAFSPLASNSERGVCVCATAIFVMVASFTKCPCYSCYVENLISLKYSTVVMHCRWIDTLFL